MLSVDSLASTISYQYTLYDHCTFDVVIVGKEIGKHWSITSTNRTYELVDPIVQRTCNRERDLTVVNDSIVLVKLD